jgi:hypothetical protein
MKLPLTIAASAALAACSAQVEQSVENQFRQTENAIENAAASLEAETENATRAAGAALENEADAFENRVDAIDVVPGNNAGNSAK